LKLAISARRSAAVCPTALDITHALKTVFIAAGPGAGVGCGGLVGAVVTGAVVFAIGGNVVRDAGGCVKGGLVVGANVGGAELFADVGRAVLGTVIFEGNDVMLPPADSAVKK
jgi:hypothetical protein